MMSKSAIVLIAGVLALLGSVFVADYAVAQGKGDSRSARPSVPSQAEGRGNAVPSPQQPQQSPADDGAQSDDDETPGAQGACPDQGRKLELIV